MHAIGVCKNCSSINQAVCCDNRNNETFVHVNELNLWKNETFVRINQLKFWKNEAQRYRDLANFKIEDIAKNGLEPDSPLLWAMLDKKISFICLQKNKKAVAFITKPQIDDLELYWYTSVTNAIFGNIKQLGTYLPINLNYKGDWRTSLFRRPE